MKDTGKIICIIMLSILIVILSSCSGNAARQYEREIESLQSTVDTLESTIEILEAKVDMLESADTGIMSYNPYGY